MTNSALRKNKLMALTPQQFSKLVTKHDLKDALSDYATRNEFNEKFDSVLTAVDGLAKKMDNFSAEMAASRGALDRHDEAIADLKTRVRVLERKIRK
jgi:DNA repair ATPase RecN